MREERAVQGLGRGVKHGGRPWWPARPRAARREGSCMAKTWPWRHDGASVGAAGRRLAGEGAWCSLPAQGFSSAWQPSSARMAGTQEREGRERREKSNCV